MIETLDDIVEELADKFGVYGTGPEEGDHPADCKCRICFCAWLKGRIERAVDVAGARAAVFHKMADWLMGRYLVTTGDQYKIEPKHNALMRNGLPPWEES